MIEKKIVAYSAGIATGIAVPEILKKYMPGSVPYLEPLGIFGTYGVFIPLISGLASLGVSQFTKIVKNNLLNNFLLTYGVAAVASAVITAVLSYVGTPLRAPARVARVAEYNSVTPASKFSPTQVGTTYYPDQKGTFIKRPQSMAKGWASDVTRNPMSAVPTKITKETVYS